MRVLRATNFVDWFFIQGAVILSQKDYLALKQVEYTVRLLRPENQRDADMPKADGETLQ